MKRDPSGTVTGRARSSQATVLDTFSARPRRRRARRSAKGSVPASRLLGLAAGLVAGFPLTPFNSTERSRRADRPPSASTRRSPPADPRSGLQGHHATGPIGSCFPGATCPEQIGIKSRPCNPTTHADARTYNQLSQSGSKLFEHGGNMTLVVLPDHHFRSLTSKRSRDTQRELQLSSQSGVGRKAGGHILTSLWRECRYCL